MVRLRAAKIYAALSLFFETLPPVFFGFPIIIAQRTQDFHRKTKKIRGIFIRLWLYSSIMAYFLTF